MFGIGFPELIVIMVVALLVFGPGRLPEIGNALGKASAISKKPSTGKRTIPRRLRPNRNHHTHRCKPGVPRIA